VVDGAEMRLHVLFDALEDVRVGLLLPFGQLVPVGDVGRFWVGDVLVDLADPAQGDEVAFLGSGELAVLPSVASMKPRTWS
jgi:hypothetical protein